MATKVSDHTVRSVASRVHHALFPSRRAVLVALVAEVAALAAQFPPAAHIAVAIVAHLAMSVTSPRR